MSAQTVLWKRLDKPGHEFARLTRVETHWQLSGTAVFAHDRLPCRLEYLIVCDDHWNSLSGKVSGWVGQQVVEIELKVKDGHWFMNNQERPEVAGAIDLDLNFSPSTNLLPIRRLNLVTGQEALVRAAWLRFPSFKLELLEQVYRRIDGNMYRYESGGGAFTADLEVNEAGFVTNYPNGWKLESD